MKIINSQYFPLIKRIIYSIINNKDPKYVCEFATCASALKHSILGDANLVELSDVERLMYEGVGKIAR